MSYSSKSRKTTSVALALSTDQEESRARVAPWRSDSAEDYKRFEGRRRLGLNQGRPVIHRTHVPEAAEVVYLSTPKEAAFELLGKEDHHTTVPKVNSTSLV